MPNNFFTTTPLRLQVIFFVSLFSAPFLSPFSSSILLSLSRFLYAYSMHVIAIVFSLQKISFSLLILLFGFRLLILFTAKYCEFVLVSTDTKLTLRWVHGSALPRF